MNPEEKFLHYMQHPHLEGFDMGHPHVSQFPFYSKVIQDCTSAPMVFMHNGLFWGAATHYSEKNDLDNLLPVYLDLIQTSANITLLELQNSALATLVAGLEWRYKKNYNYLEKHGIKFAPYSYHKTAKMPGYIDFFPQGNIPAGSKTVLVIPELQEVIMFSTAPEIGYLQLI